MLLAATLLASCATTTGSGEIDKATLAPIAHASFCSVAKPIAWSKEDTPETIEAVKEHNAVGKALCGWKA